MELTEQEILECQGYGILIWRETVNLSKGLAITELHVWKGPDKHVFRYKQDFLKWLEKNKS